ncbi:rod shape-determining protein MreD [Pantoea ananatis]|uniref:rod shape-determining protein MreD n=1 Tax=Pantoea ananas TaxID=553 RepID=UPI0039B94E60
MGNGESAFRFPTPDSPFPALPGVGNRESNRFPIPESRFPGWRWWYWVIETPDKVGLGFAFAVGVLADLLYGGVLGEQALRLVILSFIPSVRASASSRCRSRRWRSAACWSTIVAARQSRPTCRAARSAPSAGRAIAPARSWPWSACRPTTPNGPGRPGARRRRPRP